MSPQLHRRLLTFSGCGRPAINLIYRMGVCAHAWPHAPELTPIPDPSDTDPDWYTGRKKRTPRDAHGELARPRANRGGEHGETAGLGVCRNVGLGSEAPRFVRVRYVATA